MGDLSLLEEQIIAILKPLIGDLILTLEALWVSDTPRAGQGGLICGKLMESPLVFISLWPSSSKQHPE